MTEVHDVHIDALEEAIYSSRSVFTSEESHPNGKAQSMKKEGTLLSQDHGARCIVSNSCWHGLATVGIGFRVHIAVPYDIKKSTHFPHI